MSVAAVNKPAALFLDTVPIQAPANEPSLIPDLVRSIYAQTGVSLLGHFLGIVVFTAIMFPLAHPLALWGWSLTFSALWVFRVSSLVGFRRSQLQDAAEHEYWLRLWNVSAIASAGMWGVATLLFYQQAETFQRVALMLMIYTYGMGGVPYMASQSRVFIICLSLYFGPLVASIALTPEPHHLELAGIWCLMTYGTFALGRAFRRVFDDMVRLKLHNEELAAKLREEAAAAEVAQRQAELANRAKTQFFAAASHDLRQPLHAMGLFAEALRQRSTDDEVVHLVNSINSSVDALEGLFSELLDITKIDTGGVEPEPEHFSVGDLFSRLRLHFEPTAFEKGLALTFRGEQHFAYADPMLVERIVRNLVSNAIRYTEDGGVLVSCRRHGKKVLIQVWDTGIGITDKEQARIFEEFYQVQSARPLEPHHRKGLGLGLAIVKRLADLMDAPLTLRSRVNHGTTFTLELPLGKAPRWSQSAAVQNKAPLGLTLDRRLIVIVEDEPAVRDGLQVLLKGWGATVEAFDTVDRADAWAQSAAASGLKPDLLICDYRLPEQRTGIDAIKLLRERFGSSVPAIVVTGSSMVGHEDESRRHDFHILLKPVVPTKLRAMIGFKLGMKPPQGIL